jgi:hypothetical protein
MEPELSQLQSMVQQQISKSTNFKLKIGYQMDSLKSITASNNRERNEFGATSSSLQLPSLPVTQRNREDLIHSQSLSGLSKFPKVLSFNEETPETALKISVPKTTRRKSAEVVSPTVAAINRQFTKRFNSGKIRKVDIKTVSAEHSKEVVGNVSPQLLEDIGEAFRDIYTRQRLKPHPSGTPMMEYSSKIRTPTGLSSSFQGSKSHLLMDSFVSEVNGRCTFFLCLMLMLVHS